MGHTTFFLFTLQPKAFVSGKLGKLCQRLFVCSDSGGPWVLSWGWISSLECERLQFFATYVLNGSHTTLLRRTRKQKSHRKCSASVKYEVRSLCCGSGTQKGGSPRSFWLKLIWFEDPDPLYVSLLSRSIWSNASGSNHSPIFVCVTPTRELLFWS